MDTFEKDMAKKQLAFLKSINANIAFLGRELKRTNDILEKQGIAVLPTTSSEESLDMVFTENEIKEWRDHFFETTSLHDGDAKLVFGYINKMMRDICDKKGDINETE